MRKILFVLLLLLVPVVALAQVATSTVGVDPSTLKTEELPAVFELMARAFSNGNYRIAAAFLLTLLIAAFKLLGINKFIPKKHNKWVAAGLAMATSVSLGLFAGATWWVILSTGVGVGVTAIGGWELVLEPIVKWVQRKLGKGKS